MPHAKTPKSKRLDPRGPLVFDTRTLGPSSARSESRTVPAPADLGAGMVRVPAGDSLELEVQLEEVSDGILVTASVMAPLAGECARCLDEFASVTRVSFQELFAAEAGGSGDDGYLMDGDLLDLEPALRDAVVLELPLSPLCAADCPGLCGTCGARLADAGPDHGHASDGGVWAVLKDFVPAGSAAAGTPRAGRAQAQARAPEAGSAGSDVGLAGSAGRDRRQDGSSSDGTTGPVGTKER
jgi:uncharacterized protein